MLFNHIIEVIAEVWSNATLNRNEESLNEKG